MATDRVGGGIGNFRSDCRGLPRCRDPGVALVRGRLVDHPRRVPNRAGASTAPDGPPSYPRRSRLMDGDTRSEPAQDGARRKDDEPQGTPVNDLPTKVRREVEDEMLEMPAAP